MNTTKHTHKAIKSVIRPFFGPVSRKQNPAAHGGICEREFCACGATRDWNLNGSHVERGSWEVSDENSE